MTYVSSDGMVVDTTVPGIEGNYDHFPDQDKVSQFAQQVMRWAVGNGLLIGMDDGRLCPQCWSTRAEFATVVQRFCETIAK